MTQQLRRTGGMIEGRVTVLLRPAGGGAPLLVRRSRNAVLRDGGELLAALFAGTAATPINGAMVGIGEEPANPPYEAGPSIADGGGVLRLLRPRVAPRAARPGPERGRGVRRPCTPTASSAPPPRTAPPPRRPGNPPGSVSGTPARPHGGTGPGPGSPDRSRTRWCPATRSRRTWGAGRGRHRRRSGLWRPLPGRGPATWPDQAVVAVVGPQASA